MTKHSFAPVRPHNPGDATFPHQLPIELALEMNPVKEICEAYGVTKDELEAFTKLDAFVAMYDWACEEKKKPGGAFKLQMAMMADEAAKVIFTQLTDKDSGLASRMRAAELVVRYAGFEPSRTASDKPTGPAFTIAINLPSSAGVVADTTGTMRVIEGEVIGGAG